MFLIGKNTIDVLFEKIEIILFFIKQTMSDTKTCKECDLTKAESDFPKGKGVCKACIAAKTKETKEIKETKETKEEKDTKKKTPSPTKEKDEETPLKTKKKITEAKLNKMKKELTSQFETMLETPTSVTVLEFINHLTTFASDITP